MSANERHTGRELSPDELEENQVVDLPDREAMSLIQPGLGLVEGNLVTPTSSPLHGDPIESDQSLHGDPIETS